MAKQERQKKLMDLLNQNERMEVSDLAERLNCSMMTIRRDLEFLENEGVVKKIHGGVINLKNDYLQSSFYDRIKECSREKMLIGQAAVELIKNDNIVFFDASTTSLAAVDNIPNSLSFTAITNGLMTAVRLSSKPYVNVIAIGGDIDSPTLSSVNFLAIKQIELFQADLFILSTNSISYPEGIYENCLPLIELKKSFAARAEKTILLADHRKFNRKSLSLSLELKEISTIITDKKAPSSIIDKIKTSGVEVIVV
jgi:DeoR/GlpR family transcriptional regulator of sugar metabolism